MYEEFMTVLCIPKLNSVYGTLESDLRHGADFLRKMPGRTKKVVVFGSISGLLINCIRR